MDSGSTLFGGLELSTLSIPSVKITDVIDILLVAVLIYIIIYWIRKTRAWSLFKGILVILAVYALAVVFNFYTVSWILQKTLSVGIIAVIVLFQPEFRRVLEQLGKNIFDNITTAINGGSRLTMDTAAINAIAAACEKMAAEKTGALIVVEKSVPMGEIEATGVEIDAVVSQQLLVNIFVNKTPLHDGAVLIRDNRIVSAACILPLTESVVSSELGTRHRAAIGISEISDAYAFVVSEESGKISVAYGGKLTRNLNAARIQKLLAVEPKENGHKPILKGRSKK